MFCLVMIDYKVCDLSDEEGADDDNGADWPSDEIAWSDCWWQGSFVITGRDMFSLLTMMITMLCLLSADKKDTREQN